MKSVRFYAPGDLRVEDVEVPSAGAGEIVVENKGALTCGTDVKMYRRGHPLAVPPQIMGHEFSGVVTEVGSGVTQFKVGNRVVSANSAPCGLCFYCRRRQESLCQELDRAIIGFTFPGAYAEYVRVPKHIVAKNTYRLPDELKFEDAAFLEPLACVTHGIRASGIMEGDTVAVMGCGPIGLLLIQLASNQGAEKIIASDPHPSKLEVASALGASITVRTKEEDPVVKVREATEGRGADVVIEAVGRPEAWEQALQMTRPGGYTLLFGGCPSGTSATFDTRMIHYEERTLRGAFHHTPADVRRALELLVSRRVNVGRLVTGEKRLDQAEEALKEVAEGRALKILLKPLRS